MMADALSFQVVIDFFFCTKSCFFVTKIGVERLRGLNFATSSIYNHYIPYFQPSPFVLCVGEG